VNPWIAFQMLVGAISGMLFSLGAQLVERCILNAEDIDWEAVMWAGVSGAALGALGAPLYPGLKAARMMTKLKRTLQWGGLAGLIGGLFATGSAVGSGAKKRWPVLGEPML